MGMELPWACIGRGIAASDLLVRTEALGTQQQTIGMAQTVPEETLYL